MASSRHPTSWVLSMLSPCKQLSGGLLANSLESTFWVYLCVHGLQSPPLIWRCKTLFTVRTLANKHDDLSSLHMQFCFDVSIVCTGGQQDQPVHWQTGRSRKAKAIVSCSRRVTLPSSVF